MRCAHRSRPPNRSVSVGRCERGARGLELVLGDVDASSRGADVGVGDLVPGTRRIDLLPGDDALTGAETLNRSRTRVRPSSFTVTTSGPRDTRAASTLIGAGTKVHATAATTAAEIGHTNGRVRRRVTASLRCLQGAHGVQPQQLPPHRKRRDRGGGQRDRDRDAVGGRRD